MTKPTAVEGIIWLSCSIQRLSYGKFTQKLCQEEITDVYWLALLGYLSLLCYTFQDQLTGVETPKVDMDFPY